MKKSLIIGSVVFVAMTVFVLSASDTTATKRVRFKNQEIVINQTKPHIANEKMGVNIANSETDINNQALNSHNQNVHIDGDKKNIKNINKNINNQNISNHNIQYKIQNSNLNNRGNLNNTDIGFINNNTDDTYIEMSNENYGQPGRNSYQDIDWSTWKSNFVNKFLDDSMYISSLDYYGKGTWFYYSFNVSNKGEISDIVVFSLYLEQNDIQKIRNLIKSYEYKPITRFPKYSKRQKAKVKAIVLLSDSEEKSHPSDFYDRERIKF